MWGFLYPRDSLTPHAQRAHAKANAQNVAEADAEGNHGEDGDAHGIAHIVAGPEHIGQHKAQGPQEEKAALLDKFSKAAASRGTPNAEVMVWPQLAISWLHEVLG